MTVNCTVVLHVSDKPKYEDSHGYLRQVVALIQYEIKLSFKKRSRDIFLKEFMTYNFEVANCVLSSILLLRGLCIL